jgi:hypothetical protein
MEHLQPLLFGKGDTRSLRFASPFHYYLRILLAVHFPGGFFFFISRRLPFPVALPAAVLFRAAHGLARRRLLPGQRKSDFQTWLLHPGFVCPRARRGEQRV